MLETSELNTAASAASRDVLQRLNLVRMHARLLPLKHRLVQSALSDLHDALQNASVEAPFTLVLYQEELFVCGRRMPSESIVYEGLVRRLSDLGVRALRVTHGIAPEELTELVESLFCDSGETVRALQRVETLRTKPLPHVALDQEAVISGDVILAEAGGGGAGMSPLRESQEVYQSAIKTVAGAFYDSKSRQRLNTGAVSQIVGHLHDGLQMNPDLYFLVSQLREFSEYTFYHSVNVAILSMLLGARTGLDHEQVQRLGVAAMLHDVGKARVPLDILDKPGRLDGDERKVMQDHPVESVRILAQHSELHPAALAVAAQHHVGYDRTGYPNLDNYGELHLFSHIVTIADVYDALRSERSYKAAMQPDRALEIILQGSGKTFHPALARTFLQLVGAYPVGTLVELDTGEFGLVTEANPADYFRPKIKLITSTATGEELLRPIDLSHTTDDGRYPRSILRAIDPKSQGIQVPGLLSLR